MPDEAGASANEVSRRYVAAEPTFETLTLRHRSSNAGQGSAEAFEAPLQSALRAKLKAVHGLCLGMYWDLPAIGIRVSRPLDRKLECPNVTLFGTYTDTLTGRMPR